MTTLFTAAPFDTIPAMIGMPGPFELAIIGGIVLLLFGSRLPSAMRNLGQSVNSFKKGLKEVDEDKEGAEREELSDQAK